MKRKTVVFLCLTIAGSVLLPGLQQVEDMGLTPAQLEDRLLSLVNEERSRYRLNVLAGNELLTQVARAHSRKMAGEKKIGHSFPNYPALDARAGRSGLFFSRIAENVALSDTFVTRLIHQALMDSPAHRKNILYREVDHLGIGIVFDGDRYYVTQVFARLHEEMDGPEMENRLFSLLESDSKHDRNTHSLRSSPELIRFCRERSEMQLLEIPFLPPSPKEWPWGRSEIIVKEFVGESEIAVDLAEKLKGSIDWTLGVHFGRSEKHPGGLYTVTLVLFPNLLTDSRPEETVFRQINERLKKEGKNGLRRVQKPQNRIRNVIREVLSSGKLTAVSIDTGRFLYVYESMDLGRIPRQLTEEITRRNLRKIGIELIYEPQGPPFRNVIGVAVTGY